MFRSFQLLLLVFSCMPIIAVIAVGPNAKANSLTYNGTGCPQGSSSFQINENRTVMGFEEFQPSIGPGVPIAQTRKTCAVILDMSVDAGYKYRINGVETEIRGFMALQSTWTLAFKAQYAFKNDAATQSTTQFTIVGPQKGDPFIGKGSPSPAGGITSPCGGGVLNATYQVTLTSSSATPDGSIDPPASDVAWNVMTSVEWLKC
jgi:hypothetical protein